MFCNKKILNVEIQDFIWVLKRFEIRISSLRLIRNHRK